MRKRKVVHTNPSGYYWQTARTEYYVILDTLADNNENNWVRLTIVKYKPKATTFFYVVQSSDAKKKRN